MKTLAELTEERSALLGKLEDINIEISCHPDTIRGAFAFKPEWNDREFSKLLSRIGWIEPITGWTDSHKNPIQYEGWKFLYRRKPFGLIKGSNWCEEVFGLQTTRGFEELSESVVWDTMKQDDPVTFLQEEYESKDEVLVAYLLALSYDW